MWRDYVGLWLILVVAFCAMTVLSAFDSVKIGSWELRSSEIVDAIVHGNGHDGAMLADSLQAGADSCRVAAQAHDSTSVDTPPFPVDTLSKKILFIGDSMLEGLSPRLAAYAAANGHKLYTVIWYSSTSEVWGGSTRLSDYVASLNPDYIFICLGANELFVRDIAKKRDRYVKEILRQVGDIPYVWIGPPNWKEDTGINALIESNVARGSFFKSNGMTFERSRDGAHPTRESAARWMDSVARWMPLNCNHPIRLAPPGENDTKRPERIFVHQPGNN